MNRSCALALPVTLLFCAACHESVDPTVDRAPKVAALVRRLRSSDRERRQTAERVLDRSANRRWNHVEALALVAAAGLEYPVETEQIRASLLWAAEAAPEVAQVPALGTLLPRLHDGARDAAQAILADLDDAGAARLLVVSMEEDLRQPRSGAHVHVFTRLQRSPHQGAEYFPALVELARRGLDRSSVLLTALQFLEKERMPAAAMDPLGRLALEAWSAEARVLQPAQAAPAPDWWDDAYSAHREDGAIILDLLGYVPGPEPAVVLRGALHSPDPRLVTFALLSTLRRGEEAPREAFERSASSPETRLALWKGLRTLHREAAFPERWRNQTSFAEARMVEWLVHPAELGRAPDRLELMKVVTLERSGGDGPFDTYVFRFRSARAAKDGWRAGVAGPFRRADEPTIEDHGGTFSSFEPWEGRSPEAHAAAIRTLLESWWAERRKRDRATPK